MEEAKLPLTQNYITCGNISWLLNMKNEKMTYILADPLR